VREMITSVLVLAGMLFMVMAAIGAVRLPDVLCRAHAVAKALTLGIFMMLLGLWIYLGEDVAGLKVILAVFFQTITIPLAGHLVGLLALQKNLPRWRHRPIDDHRERGSDGKGG
jgi:multicomponent Na+:H+ antiporter subunit G